ncbi:unnamed protein product [Caenorhabditis angaria]|uniref:mRNA-decapping enzyme 2 n=1 Tax=Caenorhabditis angaria TaxID=860376 RepID=A0A9P1IMB3_9PELO|nr:unnamed protein product [Caenorhabditis angaria]
MPPKQQKSKKEPESVQKLLEALQLAQSKTSSSTSSDQPSSSNSQSASASASNPEFKKKPNPNKKYPQNIAPQNQPKTGGIYKKSVAARMQENVEKTSGNSTSKRQRTTSKNTPIAVSNSQTPQTPQHPNPNPNQYKGPRIPQDILDEIEFRFISNMPQAEKHNKIRISFQIELAHWFYIDHIYDSTDRKDVPNIGIRDFFRALFLHCQELRKYARNVEEIIAEWREYKSTVPTYGAIMLDESMQNVLLVQSYFAKGNSWGFPKGKVNQNEDPRDCAIRETLEETGFDFGTISNTEKKVQKFINDTMVRLYIVKNTPKDYAFGPLTRKEIRKIEWFKIADLPTDKGDIVPHLKGYNFFMVIPFVNDIRKYVEKELAKAKKAVKNAEVPKIFSQLFPTSTTPAKKAIPGSAEAENSVDDVLKTPVLKRLTSEELFQSFRKPLPEPSASGISRPTLPDISPEVDGVDSLATLGQCTPLKPPENPTQFPSTQGAPSENCPIIHEEVDQRLGFKRELFQNFFKVDGPEGLKDLIGAATSWLDKVDCVNTVMHPPLPSLTPKNPAATSSSPPQTPPSTSSNRSLKHLIGKPIQPQAIFPPAASASEMGSAEQPKRSSRISLSDNSAFTAIPKQGSSNARITAPPPNFDHQIFNLVTSPVSSGLRSAQVFVIFWVVLCWAASPLSLDQHLPPCAPLPILPTHFLQAMCGLILVIACGVELIAKIMKGNFSSQSD